VAAQPRKRQDDAVVELPLDTNANADILKRAVRVPDPYVQVRRQWVVRRLASDCNRIELADVPNDHDLQRLLRAMGQETANIHLGSTRPRPRRILTDLGTRPARWLEMDARAMRDATLRDWERWRQHG
jgi:hypothetical protein